MSKCSRLRRPISGCPELQTTSASLSTSASSPQTDHTISLPDGRFLGYAEYGVATGSPLLFFHGFPSSRLEASGLDRILRRRNLRVIAPDRPGFGLSSFQADRRITDWPADVQKLTQHLGLSKFAILGGSGGGPYALACASALPREKLSAVGLMAAAGPWVSGIQDVPWSSWLTSLAAVYTPSGLRVATDGIVWLSRRVVATELIAKRIDAWLQSLEKEADEEDDLTIEERRERLLRIAFEGFAQGARGMVQEAQLLTGDWGFRLEDVQFEKIQLWHGTLDQQSPIRMARYIAERLPHAELREFDGVDHFKMASHLEEIFSELIPDEK